MAAEAREFQFGIIGGCSLAFQLKAFGREFCLGDAHPIELIVGDAVPGIVSVALVALAVAIHQ